MSTHSSNHSNSLQKQDIGTSVGHLHPEFNSPRELQEEVILLFYNSMLDLVVREWIHVDDDENLSEIQQEGKPEDVQVKDFKDLTKEDLATNEVRSVKGSKVSLSKRSRKSSSGILTRSKFARRSRSYSKRLSKTGRLSSKIDEQTSYGLDVSDISDQYDWVLETYPENVIILFKNGNVYRGPVERKRFHGYGSFIWSDGTTYEGEFFEGQITGRGKLYYKDCSYYIGGFCKGLLHGEGSLYITPTNTLYSGEWKSGKKNGKGWLFYEPNNWYDGEWLDDYRHGKGIRQYYKGCMYQGEWVNGLRQGYGTMVWGNHDYYKGDWQNGTMHGYGEYIWKAFFNKTFSFPIMNRFEGNWVEGTRTGQGILNFGFCGGARMTGYWIHNMKHGPAVVICGNGKTMSGQPLFQYDKPVELEVWYGKSISDVFKYQSSFVKSIDKTTSGGSHESVSLSAFPRVMSNHINPLCIPIHYEPKEVDLSYYVGLFAQKYGLEESIISSSSQDILQSEEQKLRNVIISNNLALKHIYYQYAFIATKETPKFRPVLIRLFLWQLYYDMDINKRGMSLIDTDICLMENPNCGLETEHDPFERIYFWQFLQSLVAVSWKLYRDVFELDTVEGTLSKILRKFIYDDLLPNVGKKKGTALCEYKDLLPIQGVYMLYRSVGDPPTVRKLYQSCINKGYSLCSEKILEGDQINYLKSGSNATIIGANVVFLTDEEDFCTRENPTPYPFKRENVVLKNLHIFTKMKRKKLIECIAEICPPIMENGFIVNMEYPISFLEFYNIILLITCTKIEDILNYERLKEESKLEQQKSVSQNFGKGGKKNEKKEKKEKKK